MDSYRFFGLKHHLQTPGVRLTTILLDFGAMATLAPAHRGIEAIALGSLLSLGMFNPIESIKDNLRWDPTGWQASAWEKPSDTRNLKPRFGEERQHGSSRALAQQLEIRSCARLSHKSKAERYTVTHIGPTRVGNERSSKQELTSSC